MNRDEALACAESRRFVDFLGQEEGLELEFKREPYRLETESGKFELAKDVAALANAQGGVIVMGVATQRHLELPIDAAHEVRMIRRDLVDEERYADVLQDRVYPRIQGLAVRFHESDAEPAKGVLTIDVPPQDEADKYFLVRRPFAEDAKLPGWLVGVSVRGMGRVHQQQIGEIHSLIRGGLNVGRSLDALAASVADIQHRLGTIERQTPRRDPIGPADRAQAVLKARLNELSANASEPRLALVAAPVQDAGVPTLTRAEGVRTLLEQPPSARSSGWNLRTLARARIVEGSRLLVSDGGRKRIELLADGTLMAIAVFDGFLAWGSRDLASDPKIHGLAVVEFAHEFVACYSEVLRRFIEPRPSMVRAGVGIDAATFITDGGHLQSLYLRPGPISDIPAFVRKEDHQAPASEFWHTMDAAVRDDGTLDVPVVAYDLVRAVYNWFSHTDDAVPYVSGEPPGIEIEAIKALR